MKKLLIALSLFSLFTACKDPIKDNSDDAGLLSTDLVKNPRSADGIDSVAMNDLPKMVFADTTFDFGRIKDGEVVAHEFAFTNNGNNPLIISGAKASCGCTVADYPKEPVIAGKSGVIKVQFNSAGKAGHQEKMVTVTTNSNQGNHFLFLKGEVKEK